MPTVCLVDSAPVLLRLCLDHSTKVPEEAAHDSKLISIHTQCGLATYDLRSRFRHRYRSIKAFSRRSNQALGICVNLAHGVRRVEIAMEPDIVQQGSDQSADTQERGIFPYPP